MRHLDEGTIHAWLDGALSAAEEKKAEEHAARCTQCAMAVADARGLLAASSQILRALDNVPAGVIPDTGRAAPALSASVRRWPVWPARLAATILVVAVGTILVMRRGNEPSAFSANERAVATPIAPAAPAGEPTPAPAPANAPALQDAAAPPRAARALGITSTDSELKKKSEFADRLARDTASAERGAFLGLQSTGIGKAGGAPAAVSAAPSAESLTSAKRPARELAEAPSPPPAPAAAADSANAAGSSLEGAVQTTPTKVSVARAPTGSAVRTLDAERVMAPPGLRLVREETTTEQARVVQRRVYEVSAGVEVTLAISVRRADANGAAPEAPAPADRDARRASDEAAGINSIAWSDSAGTEFTLSGRLPLDSLRALRPRLAGAQKIQ